MSTIRRPHDILKEQFLERLGEQPLNLDYLEFMSHHELVIVESFSGQIDIPPEILDGLRNLYHLVRSEIEATCVPSAEVERVVGPGAGCPKTVIEREKLQDFLDTHLPVNCIAKCLGVSTSTVQRRMKEYGLSVRGTYSTITDPELDNVISAIKSQMPNAGYRMVQGHLVSMGHRVQWWRMMASMHRVDAVGIFSRLTQLGCVVRRSYSVRGPLSLVHIDTNHKLIRYNIVVFGGVDGYSQKNKELIQVWNNLRDLQDPGIDWESAILQENATGAVVVPEIECPDEQALTELQRVIDPLSSSPSHGRDLYIQFLNSIAQ